jgi:hypothetical protein
MPADELALEFSRAVAEWNFFGPELVLAARRMLEHRPDAAPLWWSAARLVTAPDVLSRAYEIVDILEGQPAVEPDHDGLSVPIWAASNDTAIVLSPWTHHLDEAETTGRPVRLVCDAGHRVHSEFLPHVFKGASNRGDGPRLVELKSVEHRIEGPECPLASELLRTSAI